MTGQPLYSFVATSRNDDHGGDILRRTQSWVTRLADQANRHQVRCELVLVDWNAPKSRPPLAEVLSWPAGSEWFSAVTLTVPPHLHRQLSRSNRLAMFQMIAKNVGIRRARGDFIIATNVDIIYSNELFQWLQAAMAEPGRLYRSDRWDIPNEIQLEPELDVLLRRARNEAIRRNLNDGTYVRRDGQFLNTTPQPFDTAFYEPLTHSLRQLATTLTGGRVTAAMDHLRGMTETLKDLRENYYRAILYTKLHTNGCGDFTMLARSDWFVLRGYPEWHLFSWAIDSAFVFQAHFNGMQIVQLDNQIVHYHIEHDNGSGWTPEGSNQLWARLDQRGIPYLHDEDFTELAKELQCNSPEAFTVYNDLDWGLFLTPIESENIVHAGTPARSQLRTNEGPLKETEDLISVCTIPLSDALFLDETAVRYEVQKSQDAITEISVETQPDEWSSSLAFELPMHNRRAADYWFKLELLVESGTVYASLLNRDETEFLLQVPCQGPYAHFREVAFHVRDLSVVSRLVFRNGNKEGACARFRIRSVELFHEAAPLEGNVQRSWCAEKQRNVVGPIDEGVC